MKERKREGKKERKKERKKMLTHFCARVWKVLPSWTKEITVHELRKMGEVIWYVYLYIYIFLMLFPHQKNSLPAVCVSTARCFFFLFFLYLQNNRKYSVTDFLSRHFTTRPLGPLLDLINHATDNFQEFLETGRSKTYLVYRKN